MIVYHAAEDFQGQLTDALAGAVRERHDELFICDEAVPGAYFARNTWFDVERVEIASIAQAARYLKGVGRNWFHHTCREHRRGMLISSQLPPLAKGQLVFPETYPFRQLGAFTLLERNTMLVAPRCSSPFPDGRPDFTENKTAPPSRAYLKLWEALCHLGRRPAAGESCLDLGASPGGWSWVLAGCGAQVTAIDRSPLRQDLMQRPEVTFIAGNAFAAAPADYPGLKWLVSDVICYPGKLLEFVQPWAASYPGLTMICTIKFQGAADYGIVAEFLGIAGSWVRHLFHNKHELTWFRPGQDVAVGGRPLRAETAAE